MGNAIPGPWGGASRGLVLKRGPQEINKQCRCAWGPRRGLSGSGPGGNAVWWVEWWYSQVTGSARGEFTALRKNVNTESFFVRLVRSAIPNYVGFTPRLLYSSTRHSPESFTHLKTGWTHDAWLQWSYENWYFHLDISRRLLSSYAIPKFSQDEAYHLHYSQTNQRTLLLADISKNRGLLLDTFFCSFYSLLVLCFSIICVYMTLSLAVYIATVSYPKPIVFLKFR